MFLPCHKVIDFTLFVFFINKLEIESLAAYNQPHFYANDYVSGVFRPNRDKDDVGSAAKTQKYGDNVRNELVRASI